MTKDIKGKEGLKKEQLKAQGDRARLLEHVATLVVEAQRTLAVEIQQGFFAGLDATLGDTQCALRAAYLVEASKETLECSRLEQRAVQAKLTGILQGQAGSVSAESDAVFNLALLSVLSQLNSRIFFYGIAIQDHSCPFALSDISNEVLKSTTAALKAHLIQQAVPPYIRLSLEPHNQTMKHSGNAKQKFSYQAFKLTESIHTILTHSLTVIVSNRVFDYQGGCFRFRGLEVYQVDYPLRDDELVERIPVTADASTAQAIHFDCFTVNADARVLTEPGRLVGRIMDAAKKHPQLPGDRDGEDCRIYSNPDGLFKKSILCQPQHVVCRSLRELLEQCHSFQPGTVFTDADVAKFFSEGVGKDFSADVQPMMFHDEVEAQAGVLMVGLWRRSKRSDGGFARFERDGAGHATRAAA